jgi:hypothetical protein
MRTITGILLGLAFASVAAWAQTSQISGVIRDPSGSAIPGATIKATQTATGVVRNATSGANGSYVLPDLPIGPYQLEVTKEGFSRSVQTGIVLQVESNPTLDVGLQVGAVSEQVSVEASAAEVETRSTSIGSVVTNQQVAEMPLNGRDPHELIFLAGMATFPGNGGMNSVRNYPTVVVSVAGGNGDGVAYLLDGTIWQDPYNSGSMPLPFPDALQEFKVETSAAPAQYGFHATATVNAVTKSGTNQYHGDLFEFVRNGDLNARDFFATTRDTLKRNQFGGVVGGPVLPRFRNKLFFFGGVQRTSLRSDGVQNTAFIPTTASLGGDFTALASPACNAGVQKTLSPSLGFVNNTISPSLLSPVAKNIMQTFPVTNNPCGKTLYGLVADQDETQVMAKMDWQISDKNSLFGRYMLGDLSQGSTFDGKNPISISSYGFHDFDYGVTLGETYLFSPNLVSSFRLGANRTNVVKIPDNYTSWPAIGANATPLAGNMIGLSVTGAFAFGSGNASPGAQHNGPMPSLAEDVNWIKGSHQIGFGGTIYQQRLNYESGTSAVGVAAFDGSKAGVPLADFMMGLPVTFAQGTIYGFYTRQFYNALYLQDNWKATSRLTVNIGIRWEPYQSYYNNRGENDHFDAAAFVAGVRSTVFANAPAGLFFPGDPQYTCGDSFNCSDWKKFFPRLGVAWDPQGNGRMTIRAAYGMYGDRSMMLAGTNGYMAPPFGNSVTATGGTLSNPWATYAGGNPMPQFSSLQGVGVYAHDIPFLTLGNYVSSPLSDFHPVYMNQWNLSIQRQIGKDWLVSANYVGNSTIHMISGESINPAVFLGLGPCTLQTVTGPVSYTTCSTTGNQNARRVLSLINPVQGQYYAGVGNVDDGGTAEYEGLFLTARKQLSHGVTAQANYTWSHCISDPYNQSPSSTDVAIPGARRQWRSNCPGIDLRQQFTLNLVATTPRFSNTWVRRLASDWQVAPILMLRSAMEFSAFSGSDRALTTVPNQTANLVNTNPYCSTQSVACWINPAAFALPTLGTYGNLGYNNLKGPGAFQLDVALSRTFPIQEKMSIQLRAEAFNLPNHLNAFAPGTYTSGNNEGANASLSSSSFGLITSDISGTNGLVNGDYRVVQLAMKFVF